MIPDGCRPLAYHAELIVVGGAKPIELGARMRPKVVNAPRRLAIQQGSTLLNVGQIVVHPKRIIK